MWRVTVLVRKSPELDDATFDRRWRQELVPAIRDTLAEGGKLERLVLDLPPTTLSEAIRTAFPKQYDGMIGLWFRSGEDAAAALGSIDQDRALNELASGVVSAAGSIAWLAEMNPCKPESGTRIKFLAAGPYNEKMTLEEAQDYYANRHPKVAMSVPEAWKYLTRYTQFLGRKNPVLNVPQWLARYRFVPMQSDMGFADADDFIAMYTHPAYLATIRPDEEKFAQPGEMISFITGDEKALYERKHSER